VVKQWFYSVKPGPFQEQWYPWPNDPLKLSVYQY